VPIAGFAELNADDQTLCLRGLVGSVDGKTLLETSINGSASSAEKLGESLADKLLAMGAGEILSAVMGNNYNG
jgi:hydroxymethylbilane synthase